MAAELRLGVSFDLAYFRTQLDKLGRIAASEFTAPIKIKLDRQVVDRELNNLQKSIKRRKYNIELNIAGNLSKKSFDELQERLDTLSQRKKIEVPVSIKNAATGKEISDAIAALRSRIAQNQSVKQGGGKLRIGVSIQASISNDDIAKFKNAVKEKFAGITNKADVSIGIKNAASGKDVADTIAGIRSRINQNQAVKQGGGKLRIGLSIKPAITNADIAGFKRTVEEKFSGLSVKIKADVQAGFASGPTGAAGLYEYMRSQGLSGGNVPGAAQAGRRAQFEARVAQANTEQLQSMLRRADVPGRSGLRTKAAMQERLRQLDDAAMEGLLGNLEMRMREPRKVERSFLDKVARAVFWMAGVDPEYLRQQAAQRRALPNVSFPATVPSGPSIGPSSTGRSLPAGRTTAGLIGAARAPVGLLPSVTPRSSIKSGVDALFAAGGPQFPMGPSGKLALSTESLRARVDKILTDYFKIAEVTIKEIFNPQDLKRALNIFSYLPQALRDAESRTRQAKVGILSAQGIAGLLPPATAGRAPSTYGGPAQVDRGSFVQQRIAEAYARSAARGAAVMAAEPRGGVLGAGGSGPAGPFRPFAQPARGGAIVPFQAGPAPSSALPPGYFEAGKLAAGIKGLGVDFNRTRLPLAGAIGELGGEFATATKQVLLFGTAYKALAFFTSLPGQAFEAAKSLQTIENQLEAVTGSVENADRSFAFVDNLATRFNVPLQSARDGFVKLYASMAPAGFSGSEIEGLFEGISKATATFGLSADQVDRVNYAFAQMASKGQIMSEELKGQLGDVLPGSLALFAKAAQMSIPEFSKAMEDGAFKGEAMAQVLRNVAKIMNSDFGGAAANAANTLQGALNGIQNAIQRMYEAFEPLVDIIASSVFPVLQTAIEEATTAIEAFGSSLMGNEGPANMLEGNALAIFKAMQSLQQIAIAVGNVLQSVAPTALLLGQSFLAVSEAIARVINNPIGAFFTNIALKIGIGTLAAAAFAKVMGFQLVASLVAAARSAATFRGALTAMVATLKASEVAAKAFRLALTGLAVGAVIIGIEALVGVIGRLASRLKDARNRAIEAREAIKSMSASELSTEQRKINVAKQALSRAQGTGSTMVTDEEYEILKGYGLTDEFEKGSRIGKRGGRATQEIKIPKELVPSRLLKLSDIEAERDRAMKDLYFTPPSPDLEKVDLAAAEGDKAREKSAEKLKEYTSDLTRQLKAQLTAKLAAIDADTNIFKREKELQKARATLEIEGQILREQARLAQEEAAQFTPETRSLFLEERKAEFAQEAAALQSEYAKVIAGPLTNAVESYSDALEEEIEKLELVNAGVDELSATQKANKLIRDSLLEVTDEDLDKVPELRDKIESLKQAFKDLGKAIDEARGKSFIGGLLNQIKDERAVLQAPLGQERLVELRQQLRRKQLPGDQAEEIFAAEEVNRKLALTKQAAADLAGTINSSVGDALSSLLTDFNNLQEVGLNFLRTLADGFKQLASTIIQEATRAFINNAVSKLFGFLAPALGAAAGGLFSGNASISGGGFGSFDGSSFSVDTSGTLGQVGANLSARPFATGGIVTGPTLGLVGEGRFNEAVVPLPNGKSIPVDLGNGAGNSISTNIVVNVNNGQTSSQVNGAGGQALGRELEGAVRSVILKEARPGGIIYNAR